MMTYRERLGELIRSARITSGLTQDQLAQKVGITNVAVCNYESGKRCPNIEMLSRISQATDISIAMLVPEAELPTLRPDDKQTTIFEVLGDD